MGEFGDAIWLLSQLKGAWKKIENFLWGVESEIAVTGVSGGGKTVLLHFLDGTAYEQGYEPPSNSSQEVEEGSSPTTEKKRVSLSIIPGEGLAPRAEGLNKIFLGDTTVWGVLHIVPFGFPKIRGKYSIETLREQAGVKTLEEFRTYQLQQELHDLKETVDYVKQSFVKHKKPIWFMVVPTKADLYSDKINEAMERYSPDTNSEFAKVLDDAKRKIGELNFRWTCVEPVCTVSEKFKWGDDEVSSVMDQVARDKRLVEFTQLLEAYCASK